MELICKIPDELYKKWEQSKFTLDEAYQFVDCVMNGTPLPENHGRLIDADALRKKVSSWGMNDYEPSDFIDEIDMADAIIEADRERVRVNKNDL